MAAAIALEYGKMRDAAHMEARYLKGSRWFAGEEDRLDHEAHGDHAAVSRELGLERSPSLPSPSSPSILADPGPILVSRASLA